MWRSQWWQSRAQRRVDSESHIAEGSATYAWEQSLAEQQRAIRWAAQWSAVRERAKVVLKTQLSSTETRYSSLPVIVVEIEDDDEGDEQEEQDDEDM